MRKRTATALIAVLAACCLLMVLSVAYPFGLSDSHATTDDRFSVGNATAYSATGEIVVDGETAFGFEGIVTPEGAWYQRIEETDSTTELYTPSGGGPVYGRMVFEDPDDAATRRAAIADNEDRVLLSGEQPDDTVVFLDRSDRSTEPGRVNGTASVVVYSLLTVAYDRTSTAENGIVRYEPEAGWYDGSTGAYRITSPSGAVRVDAETGTVQSATVSFELTRPADTYAEYALARATGYTKQHRITFEFDPGAHDLDRPAWVDDERRDASD